MQPEHEVGYIQKFSRQKQICSLLYFPQNTFSIYWSTTWISQTMWSIIISRECYIFYFTHRVQTKNHKVPEKALFHTISQILWNECSILSNEPIDYIRIKPLGYKCGSILTSMKPTEKIKIYDIPGYTHGMMQNGRCERARYCFSQMLTLVENDI